MLIFFHFPRPWICKPFKNATFSFRLHRPILLFEASFESSELPAGRPRPRFVDRRFCAAATVAAAVLEQASFFRGDRVSIMVCTVNNFQLFKTKKKRISEPSTAVCFLHFQEDRCDVDRCPPSHRVALWYQKSDCQFEPWENSYVGLLLGARNSTLRDFNTNYYVEFEFLLNIYVS